LACPPLPTRRSSDLPEPPPPPGVEETYQTIFDRSRTRSAEIRDILRAYVNTAYHPVRRGEFYSAGWLTERENLPWAKVLGNTAQPAIRRLSEHSSAGEFEEIAIEPPRSASYHVGDSPRWRRGSKGRSWIPATSIRSWGCNTSTSSIRVARRA